MRFEELNDNWLLEAHAVRVQQIQVDFRVGLLLFSAEGQAQIYLESSYHLRDPHGIDHLLEPGKSNSISPILGLFDEKISQIKIEKDGILNVTFSNGFLLIVRPDEAFEAWQIGIAKSLMVCAPGGKVMLFAQNDISNSDCRT